MKVTVHYERYDPDTVLGEKIEVRVVYSSMDKKEIDRVEQNLQESIGAGIVAGDEK